MAGARAAHAWLASSEERVRVAIVWLPMVPGDDRAAAMEEAARFSPACSSHFWDETRLVGHAWSAHFGARHREELRQAVSDIPDLVERVEAWHSDPASAPPAWDCAFFYRAGRKWTEPLPQPDAWTKQFGFWLSEDGSEGGGSFWCDRSPDALTESSWPAEVAIGMRAVGAP